MKKFRFNLEQLMRVKQWREEDAKKALATEVKAMEALQEKLGALKGELGEVLEGGSRHEGEEMVDHRGRLGILQYARHMVGKIADHEGEMAEQAARVQEKSDLLVKAMQDRKVLEKLKERRREEFRKERGRFDYVNLDEASAALMQRIAAERERREESGD